MIDLKFLAPFAGCALAEEWMWAGRDVLVVYDELTTHARAYRELSLHDRLADRIENIAGVGLAPRRTTQQPIFRPI